MITLYPPEESVINKESRISLTNSSSKTLESAKWSFDTIALNPTEVNNTNMTFKPMLSGQYKIKYTVIYTDKTTEESSTTINVLKKTKMKSVKDNDFVSSRFLTNEEINKKFFDELFIDKKLSSKETHFIKRNARYRGHRESEKYLSGINESVLDIKMNFKNIYEQNSLIESTVNAWKSGEMRNNKSNHAILIEKVYEATREQVRYRIVNQQQAGVFKNLVVKLNNEVLTPDKYIVDGNELIILVVDDNDLNILAGSQGLKEGTLQITCEMSDPYNKIDGLNEINQKVSMLNQHIRGIEERFSEYENAYK